MRRCVRRPKNDLTWRAGLSRQVGRQFHGQQAKSQCSAIGALVAVHRGVPDRQQGEFSNLTGGSLHFNPRHGQWLIQRFGGFTRPFRRKIPEQPVPTPLPCIDLSLQIASQAEVAECLPGDLQLQGLSLLRVSLRRRRPRAIRETVHGCRRGPFDVPGGHDS